MTDSPPPARRRKSDAAFRTIREVAETLDVPPHVLRFWETRFSQIRPVKRAGGRRYYRPDDVALLRRIRGYLYDDGFTIKGVQKLLRDGGREGAGEGIAPPSVATDDAAMPPAARAELQAILEELGEARQLLRTAMSERCHRRDGEL